MLCEREIASERVESFPLLFGSFCCLLPVGVDIADTAAPRSWIAAAQRESLRSAALADQRRSRGEDGLLDSWRSEERDKQPLVRGESVLTDVCLYGSNL